MSIVLTIVFEGSWFKPEYTMRFVVDSLEQAKEIVEFRKKYHSAKMKSAYVTQVFYTD